MDKRALSDQLSRQRLKLTGPPEHWLTTVTTGFWGLTPDYQLTWSALKPGDLCVIHSTRPEYLASRPGLDTGIIGVGAVAGTRRKKSHEWIGEFQASKNIWPLLIDFSEIWWFGNSSTIQPDPIQTKMDRGEAAIIVDLRSLTKNCLTFRAMRQKNCEIARQRSILKVDPGRKTRLVPLLESKLREAVLYPRVDTRPSPISKDALGEAIRVARRGGGESPEHRQLKEYVAAHPEVIGLPRSLRGRLEHDFPSGDRVDVAFRVASDKWVVVEVELEGRNETLVGLFQSVKYRALQQAVDLVEGVNSAVEGVLVAKSIPPEVRSAAQRLGIKAVEVSSVT